MLKRKIWDYLKSWKEDPDKKALLVTGARQIGKTYIIRRFGQENYKSFIEINFVENEMAAKIFSEVSNVDMIITNLTAYTGKKVLPGETLIFLDEIQE